MPVTTQSTHFGSILVLLKNNFPSGAFALARPLFESYVRAIWSLECATDDQLHEIIDHKNVEKMKFPWLDDAINEIINGQSYHTKFVVHVTKKKRQILNDWVHGGVQVCARQFDGTNIKPMYPVVDQLDLLESFVKPILFQSGMELLDRLGLGQQDTLLTFARVIGQELEPPFDHTRT